MKKSIGVFCIVLSAFILSVGCKKKDVVSEGAGLTGTVVARPARAYQAGSVQA